MVFPVSSTRSRYFQVRRQKRSSPKKVHQPTLGNRKPTKDRSQKKVINKNQGIEKP